MTSILQAARDKITTHGWLKGRVGNHEEGFCILGAVCAAIGDQRRNLGDQMPIGLYGNTYDKLVQHLPDMGTGARDLVDFNDHFATEQHMFALFDKAIANE